MDPDVHPADIDETAEAYLMGRMTPEESTAFEDHYITCQRCDERLQAIQEFRDAIRSAASCRRNERGQ
jgi:anti-sigma factor RsiW